MTRDDWLGEPERVRREIANQHRDEVVEGSGRPIEPKVFGRWPTEYRCEHVGFQVGGGATLLSVSSSCGCKMVPVP